MIDYFKNNKIIKTDVIFFRSLIKTQLPVFNDKIYLPEHVDKHDFDKIEVRFLSNKEDDIKLYIYYETTLYCEVE